MFVAGMSVAPVGLIKKAVKKARTKKATSGVEGMLAEYRTVQQQLMWQQRGGGARREREPTNQCQ